MRIRKAKSKDVKFLGNSRRAMRSFPDKPMDRLGHQLRIVQYGGTPSGWKPVNGLGKDIYGVRELRYGSSDGWFRVVYVTNIGDKIYVLHAFQKKTNQIEKPDRDIIVSNYRSIAQGR